jgi:hypothetical protein
VLAPVTRRRRGWCGKGSTSRARGTSRGPSRSTRPRSSQTRCTRQGLTYVARHITGCHFPRNTSAQNASSTRRAMSSLVAGYAVRAPLLSQAGGVRVMSRNSSIIDRHTADRFQCLLQLLNHKPVNPPVYPPVPPSLPQFTQVYPPVYPPVS